MTYSSERFEMLLERWERSNPPPDHSTCVAVWRWLLELQTDPYPASAKPIQGFRGLLADIPGTPVSFWYDVDEDRRVVVGLMLETL